MKYAENDEEKKIDSERDLHQRKAENAREGMRNAYRWAFSKRK